MRITEIKLEKRNPARCAVYVDGKYKFSADIKILLDENLHIDDEVDDEIIEKIKKKDELPRARDYAYLLFSYRERSEYELYTRLKKKGFSVDIILKTIKYFKNLGLIDDRKFAENWVESHLISRPIGKLKARFELKKRFIDDVVIEEVCSKYFNEDEEYRLCKKAFQKKLKECKNFSNKEKLPRIKRFLQGRGFSFDIIRRVMEEAGCDNFR